MLYTYVRHNKFSRLHWRFIFATVQYCAAANYTVELLLKKVSKERILYTMNLNLTAVLSCISLIYFAFRGVSAQYAITTTEGETVQIPCHAAPNTTVSWQYRRWLPYSDNYVCIRGAVTESYRTRIELNTFYVGSGNYSLIIHNVNANDSGIYSCVELDGSGPRHHSRLTVLKTNTFSDVKATVGSVAHLPCQTAVQTWVHWVHQDNETSTETTISSEGNVELQYRDQFELSSFYRGDYTLTINNIRLADSGLYTCIERESNTESRHTVRLSVDVPEPDACSSNPCRNCGACSVTANGGYSCSCSDGYSGKNCERDVNECSSSPCWNDGTCIDGVNKFTCVCVSGFIGTVCDQHIETVQPPTQNTSPIIETPDLTGAVVGLSVTLALIIIAVVGILAFVLWRRRADLRYWGHTRSRREKSSEREKAALLELQKNFQKQQQQQTIVTTNNNPEVINKYIWVSGVTVLDNKLCMLRGHLIQVYETERLELIQSKSLPELLRHYRNDITSCEKNRCLYISDYLQKCIHKLQLPLQTETEPQPSVPVKKVQFSRLGPVEPEVTKTAKWSEVEYRPSGLSVTRDQNLLVTCVNDHKLIVLSARGDQLREIKLESDIELPLHAVENPSVVGQYFVSHSGDGVWLIEAAGYDSGFTSKQATTTSGGKDGKTMMVGSIKGSYGGQTGSQSSEEFAWPCHMAVNEDGSLYVADKYNNRVVLLSSELKFVKVVKQLHRPRRLCLDAVDQKLYIGQKNGEVVWIGARPGPEHPDQDKTGSLSYHLDNNAAVHVA